MSKETSLNHWLFTLFLLGLLLALLTACAPVSNQDGQYAQINGEFYYKEKTALKPGSYAYVTLIDVSKMDVAATVIISQKVSLDGKQVPVAYQLKVPADLLHSRHRYSVRVQIRDQSDILMWTSDSAHLIDPNLQMQTLDPIQLVRVIQSASASNALQNTKWRVEDIAGKGVMDLSMTTLEFSDRGQLAGTAGCNQYSASYQVNQNQLSVGIIKVTQRACIPALASQEVAFLKALKEAKTISLDHARGLLVIHGNNDSVIKAAEM